MLNVPPSSITNSPNKRKHKKHIITKETTICLFRDVVDLNFLHYQIKIVNTTEKYHNNIAKWNIKKHIIITKETTIYLFRDVVDLNAVNGSGEDQGLVGGAVVLADLFANRKRLQPLKEKNFNNIKSTFFFHWKWIYFLIYHAVKIFPTQTIYFKG